MKKLLLRLKQNKYLVLLAILSAVILASTIRYGLRTYKVPEWDEQHYMRMATQFYRLFKHLSFSTPYEMLQIVPFRQPGYPLLIVPFLMLFGLSSSYFWGIFTNGLLYVLSIFGIYFLARNYISKLASFMSALIFSSYGWTLLHMHLTYSETASSAFIVWTIFFLIKSNLFQNKKYSILFGLFLGLGLLIRWIIILYVFAPLLYVFFQLFKKKLLKKKILLHLIFSFFLSFLVSFYPYFQNRYWIFQYFYDVGVGSPVWRTLPQNETNPISLYSLTFYLNTFAQLGIFFFILIIVGFVLALRRNSNIKPILLTIITGYLFAVLAPIKGERYIVPIFPYLAIMSGLVFNYLKDKKLKLLLIIFAVALSILSFLGSMWGKGPMRESLYSLPVEFQLGQLNKIYLTTISKPPYIYKISGKEILDVIAKDSKVGGIENPQILALFYYRPLDEPLMAYNLYNEENPLQINNYVGTVINDPDRQAAYFVNNIKNTDYVLTKSGQRIDNNFSEINYRTLKALISLFDNNLNMSDYWEEKAKVWINQDSSTVTIFKKKKEIPPQELERIILKFIEILKTQS